MKTNVKSTTKDNRRYFERKPEVTRIFNDLEDWLNHCREHLLKFDPADLYKSRDYRDFAATKNSKQHQRPRLNTNTKQQQRA